MIKYHFCCYLCCHYCYYVTGILSVCALGQFHMFTYRCTFYARISKRATVFNLVAERWLLSFRTYPSFPRHSLHHDFRCFCCRWTAHDTLHYEHHEPYEAWQAGLLPRHLLGPERLRPSCVFGGVPSGLLGEPLLAASIHTTWCTPWTLCRP